MTDILDTPVTLRDLVGLLTVLTIEIMDHATLTAPTAQESLIDMANQLLANADQTTNPRAAACFRTLAKNFIATEPGA